MNKTDNYIKQLADAHQINNIYENVFSPSDLYTKYMKCQKDLAYNLRKEVKRDRFVANYSGLQKHITDFIIEILNDMSTELTDTFSKDLENQLINILSGNKPVKTPSRSTRNIGVLIGKRLGASLAKIYNDV